MTLVSIYLSHHKYNRLNICAQLCISYAVHKKGKYSLRFLGVTYD